MSSKRLLIVFCLVLAFMAIAPLKTAEAAIYWDKWFSGGQLATMEAIAITPYSATLKGYVDWANRHGGHDLVLWAQFKYRDVTAGGEWKTLTVSPVPTYGDSFSEKLSGLTPGHTYEFYAVVKMTSSGTHEDKNGIKKFQTPGGDATPWNAYSSVGVVATQDPWGIGQYEATLRGHVEWENQHAMIDLVRSAHFTFIDLTDSSKGWQTVTVSPVPTSGGDYSVTLKGLTPGHTYKYYTYVHMTMSGKHEDSAHAKTFTTKEGNGTPWDEYSSRGVVATLEAQNVTQYGAELRGYVNWDNKHGMIDLVKNTKFYYEDTTNPYAGPREVSGSVPSNGGYFSARLSGLVPGHTYRFYAIVGMTMTGSHHDSKHTLTFTTQPGQVGSWQPPAGSGAGSDGIVAPLPVTNIGKYSADLNCHVEWQNRLLLPDWISDLGFVYSDGTITGQTRQASKSLIVFPVATKGGDFTVHLKGLQPGRTYACYPYVEMSGVDPKWMSRAPAVEFTTLPGTGAPWQDEYSIGIISTLPAENVTDTSAVLRAHVEWQDQVYYHNLVLEAGFKYQDITAGDKEWETARVTLIPTYGGDFSVKITGLTKGHAYRFYPWVTMTMQGPGHGHYNDQEHAHVFTAGGRNKINIEANLPTGYVGKSYSGTLTASGGDGKYTWSGSVQGSSYRVAKNNGLVLYPDGIISGAPLEVTPENLPLQVWVTVTDTSGNVGTGTFTIPVEEPLRITNQSLPGCVVGTPYKTSDGKTVTLTAAGGKGPYTWTGTINPANGLTFNADGSITGTPQKAGTSLVQARLTDSKGRIATANLSIQVVDRMSITTTSLPDGIAGLSYQTSAGQPVKLTATGGDGRYTWSGTISPANGLTLKADGSIVGTPQAPAVSTITATVKDGFGQVASASFTIRVVKQMQITTTMLPGGVTGEYYKPFDAEDITLSDIQKWASSMDYSSFGGKLVTLAATGGDGKYTWSGTITPANGTLKVTADGQIIGTPDKPTGATPLTVQVEVKDGSGNKAKAKASFKLFINDPLPAAFAGKLYSVDLAGSGGDGKYTWSGTVTPANGTLKVTADGKITGTPAAATTPGSPLTVQAVVKDGSGNAGGINLRLSVLDKDAQPLTITTKQLPEAETNQYYLYILEAEGGKGPYTWTGSITPANGLTVDRSGVILGKPKSAVTSVVDVTVTDSTGSRAKAKFTIKPKGLITLNLAETTIDMDSNSQIKCFFTVNPADAVVSAYSSNSGTVSCSLGGSGGSYWLNLKSGLPTSASDTTAVITVSASKAGYTGTTRSFSVRVPYKAPYIKVVSDDASSDDVYIRTAPRLTTLTAAPGTVAGSTKLALGHNGAVSYAVCILGDVYAYPNVGDRIPAWVNPYIPEANIENVTAGMRLGIYALDSNGRVIAFSDHVLSASEIAAAAPPIESFEVLPVIAGATEIIHLSHTGASSYVIYVQAGPFATPLEGDSPPAGAVPYDAEAEINEITGAVAGQHLGMYALDSSGKIIAFSDYMLVEDSFVPVSGITGVPTAAFIGYPLTIAGTVEPGNATNRTIFWSIKDDGYTESELEGNTLTAWGDGTVILTATITNGTAPGEDYAQDFEVTVTRFYQVDNITGVPTTVTFGTPLPLTGTVEPDYATNQTIVWSVKDPGTTVATITGNTLSTRAVGTVIVTATIANGSKVINDVDGSYSLADYTQDFEIEVRELVLNPAPPLTTVTAEPGTIANSTRLTNLYYDGAVSYAVCILGDFYAHPNVGDSIPAGVPAYNLGDNITDVTAGTRLGIYALDSDGKVIAFSDHVLAASEVEALAPPEE